MRTRTAQPVAAAEVPRSRLDAWLTLIRVRVAVMVFAVTFAGAMVGGRPDASFLRAAEAALYLTLVTGAASILNQVFERDTDAKMERTRHRPLVVGSVATRDALFAALALGVLGVVGLALSFQLLSALLALATLAIYVGIYTPLKRVSTLNTVIGAIPGAAPPLIGYAALAGHIGPWAWVLFGVVFAWQFPHFMAIAWIYREDYRRAGLRMLPCVDDAEGLAGRQAVLYGLALLPVSLLPVTAGLAGPVYGLGALVLGLAYLSSAVGFALKEDAQRARALVVRSLYYLPLLFLLVLVDPSVSSASLSSALASLF